MRSSQLLAIGLVFVGQMSFGQSLKETTIDASKYVSQQIQDAAEFIDLSLAGKKYTDQRNNSTVTLSQMVSLTEGGVWQNSSDIGVNIRLPNVEKHWQAR